MSKALILSVFSIFVVSCRTAVLSSHDIIDVLSTDGVKFVYVSNYNYRDNNLYDSFLKYRDKNENCFYCDVGIVENISLLYAYQFNQLPALIKISEDNLYSDVLSGNFVPKKWFDSEIDSDSGEDEIMLVSLHCAIRSKDVRQISLILPMISPSDFYTYYLFYKSYDLLGNDRLAKEYREKAILFYENNPMQKYSILFKELVNSEMEHPVVIFGTRCLDFGIIDAPGRYTKSINYRNYSNQPAIIMDVIPSCNCLEVEFKNIVGANEEGEIKISFIAEGKPTHYEFSKSIYLVTNFQASDICLNVKGIY